eukprot:scaffold9381_cov163-Cylindrotheca_fusiformis.AAC.1
MSYYTGRLCDVMPYSYDYEAKTSVPIVQVATGYTSANGVRCILIINEAIWMPDMENSLMNPNQLREFGITVQDNPYDVNPMVIRKDEDENGNGFVACLKSEGTNIFVDTWTPTDRDLEEYRHMVLTASSPWDPHAIDFPASDHYTVNELEGMNVAAVETSSIYYRDDIESYGDPYCE